MSLPFRFKEFQVQQAENVFKVGTDACILAAAVNQEDVLNVLEIGSGTGVISLMIAQRNSNAKITAIEIQESAYQLSKTNFAQSPWNDRLNVLHVSWDKYVNSQIQEYDLIISNPPYFTNSLQNNIEHKRIARHDALLPLADIINSGKKILSPNGKIALILPMSRRLNFLKLLELANLFEHRFIEIHPIPNSKANRFISEIGFSQINPLATKLIVYSDLNKLSNETATILKPFYLHL